MSWEMVMELLVIVIRHLLLASVNLSLKVFFLFLHVMAILGNLVAMLENVVPILGVKMTIMKTLFTNLG